MSAEQLRFTEGEEVIYAARDDRGHCHDLKARILRTYPNRAKIKLRSSGNTVVAYKYLRSNPDFSRTE